MLPRKSFVVLALLTCSVQQTPILAADHCPSCPKVTVTDMLGQYQSDEQSIQGTMHLPGSLMPIDRMDSMGNKWKQQIEKLDFDGLDQHNKISYLLLVNEIEKAKHESSRSRKHLTELLPYAPFTAVVNALEEARWKAGPLDCETAATKVAAIGASVKEVREKLAKEPKKPLPPQALKAAQLVQESQGVLHRWYGFYENSRPEFSWWVKKPFEEANKQLDDYVKLLREEFAGIKGKEDDPLVGEPLGPEALAENIRTQWLPYTADELIDIAQRDLAFCEQQRLAAAKEMKFGDDWRAAVAKVKTDHAPAGQQDELVARIAHEVIAFVKKRDLIEVPPLAEESWRLSMIPAEGLKVTPYAYYGGNRVSVAFASGEMKQDDKEMTMRDNNRHFMRVVIPHELIPGHHLQGFFADRYVHRNTFTSFYIEGWALYWELRLWGLGWAKTPEDRIGMLFWRMERDARVIVSLKYHQGKMKPDEMVKFLMERVGNEKFGATSEVRRFISAEPLYQVGYMIGGKQQLALHDEAVAPGKWTERQYHEAALKIGSEPIELLRAELLNLPIKRDAKPGWKFNSTPR